MAKKIKVTLPDNSVKTVASGTTAMEVVESIGKRLASDAVVAEIDGELVDLSTKLIKDAKFKVHTFSSGEGRDVFWHSTAHLLAQAVLRLYPEAKLTIGPSWENGFYYDIAHPPFKPNDLEKIEKEMTKIVDEKHVVKRLKLSKAKATKLFKDNKYKLEIIEEDAKGKPITAYQQGEFIDLCRGPHTKSTGDMKAFKLTKVSAAYWRGDQKNDELQRIYGISFPDKKLLNKYLSMVELAEKNDHRKLGKELDLFWFHDWSPGTPFFLPKGATIYNILIQFLRDEYQKRGYSEVITPLLYNKKLWELSGHWQHYKENMFLLNVDDTEFSLKPMNCPGHVLMFSSRARSYRELPMRIADFAVLHRNELRGVLAGTTRVRKFQQDDAHVFCTEEQIGDELDRLMDFTRFLYADIFKFEFSAKLSTKPEKSMGDGKLWDVAENALQRTLEKNKFKFVVKEGEGAFYGPKIDIDVKDSLGREHQLGTIQLDFQMPKKMSAEYEGADGKKHTAIMIHRALLGSFERFIAILIEHYGGKFPMWLSPTHVTIITIADRFNEHAMKVEELYRTSGIRVEMDMRSESVSYKVREAELSKVPYILVIGQKEVDSNTVTVRTRENKILGAKNTEEFLKHMLNEISTKK